MFLPLFFMLSLVHTSKDCIMCVASGHIFYAVSPPLFMSTSTILQPSFSLSPTEAYIVLIIFAKTKHFWVFLAIYELKTNSWWRGAAVDTAASPATLAAS